MTYTKFAVKAKKDSPYIPEYKIQFPQEKVEEPQVQVNDEPPQPELKSPEILISDMENSETRAVKPTSLFYTAAVVLSMLILISSAFLLKYAYDNDVYAPKKICEFFRRASYSLENKSVAAFSACPIEEIDALPAALPIADEEEAISPEIDDFETEENVIIEENFVTENDALPVTHTEDSVKSELGENALPILKADVSYFGERDIINETDYSPDLSTLAQSVFADSTAEINPEEPLILIYHTHGTESYSPSSDFYTQSTPTRSDNTEINIVSIGKELQNVLLSFGLNAVHCETMHDYNAFNSAYSNSYKSVKSYLERYPSIKYIIDVHRDSIVKTGGEKLKTYAVVNGEETAQVMLVVGTDAGGKNHPDWKKNLSLAAKIKNELDSKNERFSRPINLRKASFNQELCDNALLLEVGSCGNTHTEAESAIKIFGISYARVILNELGK